MLSDNLIYGIGLNGSPVTLEIVHRILYTLLVNGEVHVVGGQALGPGEGGAALARLLALLSQRLSEDDWKRLREEVREAIEDAAPPL